MVAKGRGARNSAGCQFGRGRPRRMRDGAIVALVRWNRQNGAMSHDASFPESPESPERRSERALAALQYEERAGLGFRRRDRAPIGDPYSEPERFQIDREPTPGELWAGMLAGIAAVVGFSAIFYKPLLLGTVAVILAVFGSLADGSPSRVARIAMVVTGACFVIGMLVAIFLTKRPIW